MRIEESTKQEAQRSMQKLMHKLQRAKVKAKSLLLNEKIISEAKSVLQLHLPIEIPLHFSFITADRR
jgi:hypothetical protein